MPEQANPYSLQNAFHERLTRYANGGHLAAGDLALSAVSMRLSRRRHEVAMKREFLRLRRELVTATEDQGRTLRIAAYDGTNREVMALRAVLGPLASALRGAIVHGSLASGDDIAYSDLDALVILRDRVFHHDGRLAATATALSRARRRMFALDPLQHHGWFVLTESDLRCYPESYLPIAAFERSANLGDGELELDITLRPSRREAIESLGRLATGVLQQCAPPHRPRDLYRAKSFLSRLMLLPAAYLHARDGHGVGKAESFALARPDFPAAAWQAIELASDIRQSWRQPLSPLGRRVLDASLVARPFLMRRLAPTIPTETASRLDASFYVATTALTESLQDRNRQFASECDA